MNKTVIASLMLVYFTSGPSVAMASTEADLQAPSITYAPIEPAGSHSPQASFASWLPSLMQKFNALPEVVAQQARRNQAELNIKAADQAVYNPELGVDYQNAGEDTYTLGISQTIDWGDKRGAATRRAQLESEILLSDISLERSQMLADSILALVEQAQSRKAVVFQKQQLQAAKTQFEIAKQQMQVGELSAVELKLIQLDVASKAADYAVAEQASIASDANVMMLLGDSEQAFGGFIEALTLPAVKRQVDPDLPALKSAYQQVLLARATLDQVKADTAIDPTVSLNAEREGEENKFGMGISIPLQIRNNYSETLAVASQDIAIAEQGYLARERVLTHQQKKFNLSLPRLTERYQDWRELVLNSGQEAASALGQQWRAGDINTSDYLQSQRQLSSSYLVGLELETALYQSWLEWMGASGQLESFLQAQLSGQPLNSASNAAAAL
ncbi:TolC family protein [uncultured Shewanella sp.]|uniref:TolC family protein n=1 Tax=Shewanella atlantica TaxID=271099 RepID=UPI0026288C85|nr:TolC family protein [uncultured Shewanella sp.]